MVVASCKVGNSGSFIDAGNGSAKDATSAIDGSSVDGGVGSTGCVDGTGLSEGEHQLTVAGMERRYLLYLPTEYSRDREWPLVFALHPNGNSAAYWDSTAGDRNIRGQVADEAILVIAEAIGGNWRDYNQPQSSWPARLEIELDYFDQVLAEVSTNLCLNENRIFSVGFSGGGSFSGVLGCRRDYIRAFAGGGSVIYFDSADCVQAPAAWVTIGELERVPAREAFRNFFRDGAGCSATSTPIEPSPCVAYDGCATATPVVYCEHPGDHIWPNFGTTASWAFLKQFN